MAGKRRGNHALVYVGAQLGEDRHGLDLEWAEFVGDRTPEYEFTVPTSDAQDAYVGLQAFDVGTYGHEIVVNGESLGGFDIPPRNGWQYWIDALSEAQLVEGENTVQVARDAAGDDSFAVGSMTVHWTEPVEE